MNRSRKRITESLPEKKMQQEFDQGTENKSVEENSASSGIIRFVHAADLHLDATFAGISRDLPQETAKRLHRATFDALNNLFNLCEHIKPDFLILAGDIYNQEDHSLMAQLAVRDGCLRLNELGIKVFIAHGNHDPLSSRLKNIVWPDNVTFFGEQVSTCPVYKNGKLLAIVHGISHAGPKEGRNLATAFKCTDDTCLQVGVLHTTLAYAGAYAGGEKKYAPCSVDDLKKSGLDYWALGHIHDRHMVCEKPLTWYPGSSQGLHINETGPHGCLIIEASPKKDSFSFSSSFQPLGPIEWQSISISLKEESSLDDLQNVVRETVSTYLNEAISMRHNMNYIHVPLTHLILRLSLEGRTILDNELRDSYVVADLLEHLREELRGIGAETLIWIKDLQIVTRPVFNRAMLAEREDLLGEILRLSDRISSSSETLSSIPGTALGDLYMHAKARKILVRPDEQSLRNLLLEAEANCLNLLEND